jgi:hypothetical protein
MSCDGVGDDQHRRLDLVPQVHDELLHVVAGRLVEGGERLVHQDDARLQDQAAGDGHSLLLSPGELMGVLALVVGQPHPADPVAGPALPLRGREPQLLLVDLQPEGDVLEDGPVGERAVLLEDHSAVVTRSVHPLAPHQHLARRRGVDVGEALDEVEDRRLAAARRTDDGDELPVVGDVLDLEGEILDRGELRGLSGVEGLRDVAELHHRRGVHRVASR